MKKVQGSSGVGQFFVTGPTDVATKPSHFYLRFCLKDVFVLTHGHHEVFRHFQDSKHFPLDQRLRFLRTWDIDIFKRDCVATLDRYSSNPHQEITALGRIVAAVGPDMSVASISGGSTVLDEAFCENLGSGCRQ